MRSSVNGPVARNPVYNYTINSTVNGHGHALAREAVAFRRRSDHWLIKSYYPGKKLSRPCTY